MALPDVPAPLRVDGRAHGLAHVLEIALARVGLSLGYDAIMGLCGLAFRTPPWPEPPAPTVAECLDAIESISRALGGCLAVCEGAKAPGEEEVLEEVARSVDAGRPCIALGWGSNKDHWSVIAGYDRGKGRLIGHCLLDAPRRQYESWPPTVKLLITVNEEPRPRGAGAISETLQAGARRWTDEGERCYAAWIEEMRLLDEPPGGTHEQAVELLADARAAAAGFAEQVARREDEIAGAWLSRAAQHWRELVRLLEARGVPHSPEALIAVETAEDREDWANLLQAAVAAEERAARSIRLALTADYLPDEAADW